MNPRLPFSSSSSLLSSTLAHRTYVSRPPERNTIDEEPTIDPNHVDEDEIPSQLPKKSRKDKLYDFFIDRSPRATGHEDQWLVKNEKKMWTLSATTMAILLFLIFLPADDPRLDSIEWSKFPIEWVQTLGKEADGAAAAEGGSGSGKAAGQASSDGLYKVITVRTPDDHKPIKGNPETCVEGMYHVMIMDPELQIERVSCDLCQGLLVQETDDFCFLSALHYLPSSAACDGYPDSVFHIRQARVPGRGLAVSPPAYAVQVPPRSRALYHRDGCHPAPVDCPGPRPSQAQGVVTSRLGPCYYGP